MQNEKQTLERGLKNRHVQLMAIGGAIGTGLFLGSGESIHLAGPSILLAYALVGLFCFFVMRALGELLLSDTSKHSFIEFIAQYLGPKAGFITGWTYWFCWISLAMADLTATGTYFKHWFPNLQSWIPELIILVCLLGLNLIAVKFFGELEFWFALIKVIAIIALIVVGIGMIVIGFQTDMGQVRLSNLWTNGGFFPTGVSGFMQSFKMATFAFVGVELVGIISGETDNPTETIPKAINSIAGRILLFYIGSLAIIMSIYPWNSLQAGQSPFVEVFSEIGIGAAATIVNLVVLTSAMSACNSAIYSTGRMIHSLSAEGNAPKKYQELTKHRVPAKAIYFSSAVIALSILLNYLMPARVFELITSISTICFLFIWFMIVYTHYVYRKKNENQTKTFKMPLFPYTTFFIFAFFIFIIGILFLVKSTREVLYFVPIWFILLGIIYHVKFSKKA